MLTPDYLTTNQSEESPPTDHAPSPSPMHTHTTPLPSPVFENLCLKAFWKFGVFEAAATRTPCLAPAIKAVLSFTTT